MWTMLHDWLNVMKEHFQRGGDVMPPLLLVSILMWLLILRVVWQLIFTRRDKPLADCLLYMQRGNISGSGWQRQFLQNFLLRQSHTMAVDHRLIEELVLVFRNRNRRYIDTVLILAAAAPLLGLLGTVMGMVTTFDTIGRFGTGNARALAAGISEALITTQTGLIISVPGLLVGTLLKRRLDKLEDNIRRFGLGVSNHFDLMYQTERITRKTEQLEAPGSAVHYQNDTQDHEHLENRSTPIEYN